MVRLIVLQLEEKLLVQLIHEFKQCTLFGVAAWQNFRMFRGSQLLELIERDYAYVKTELEDHLNQLTTQYPKIVSNSYSIFSSNLASCL